jgi:hypothetical protein
MNCRKEWNIERLNDCFSKSFLKTEYRQMRETILFEEEKTYLPELQEEAERILHINKLKVQIENKNKEICENNNNENQMVFTQRAKDRELRNNLNTIYNLYNKLLYRKTSVIERKKFIMKCVVENCRGFLSDKYVCGLCNTRICKDCHSILKVNEIIVKKIDAASAELAPVIPVGSIVHQCDPNEVATINELNKSTKPCPKCHAPIFKTDGCNQMFCILCHTAFSWTSGQIELGVIHNPEYFRLLRSGNIQDPRHRQNSGPCGPIPSYQIIANICRNSELSVKKRIEIFYQQFVHHRNVTLPQYNQRQDRTQDRIKYLTGEYDEKKFKQKLYVFYQSNLRKREEQQILESFVVIGEELFRSLDQVNILDILQQLNTLKDVTKSAIIALDDKYSHAGLVNAVGLFYMF